MRRPNLRFLFLFIGTLLVAIVAVHFVHGYQARRTAGILLEKARELRKASDLWPAVGYYGRYLQLNPGDTDALGEYGQTLALVQPESADTLMVLEQILRRDAQHREIRTLLVDVAMRLGRFGDAASHLEVLIRAKPSDDKLYALRGDCERALRDFAAAQQDYRKAIELAPAHLNAYLSLAMMLRENLEQPAEADQVITLLSERNQSSAEAHLISARYWQFYGYSDRALANAQAALQIDVDSAEAALLAATASITRQDVPQARSFVERAKKLDPANDKVHLVAAQIELAAGSREGAVGMLREGLQQAPASVDLRWQLANLLVEQGELAEVESLCKALDELPQGAAISGYLQSRLLMQNGDVLAAHAKLEGLRLARIERSDLRQQIEFWLGVCADRIDNVDQRIAAYRRAVEINPNWEPALIGLANALAAAGRIDEALENYNTLLSGSRVRMGAMTEVCRLLILQQLRLPEDKRDWTPVQEFWKEAARQAPEAPGLAVLLAEIYLGKRQPQRAVAALEASCLKNPEAEELWIARAVVLANQERLAEAVAVLAEAEAKFGPSSQAVALRLRMVLASDSDLEPKLDLLCEDWGRFSADERFQLHQLAGAAYSSVELPAKADAHWVEATRLRPEWLPGYLSQFATAAANNDNQRIEALLTQIRKLETRERGPLWCYGEAARLLIQGDQATNIDRARQLLAEAIAQRPQWPQPHVLLAQVERLQDNLAVATDHYRAALELGDRSPSVVQELVLLLIQRRRFPEADQVLRRLESPELMLSSDLSRVGSELSVQTNDYARALRLARQAADESKSAEDLLWLARLYEHEKSSAEAEVTYRQAVQLHPADLRVWLAFARHWIARAEPLRAEQTVTDAKAHLDPSAAVLLEAEILDAQSRTDEAVVQYRELVKIDADNPASVLQAVGFLVRIGEFADAETALRRLLAAEVECSPAQRGEVRRRLALVLGQSGEYPRLQEAANLIKQNESNQQPLSLEDLRIRGILLSGMPDFESRRQGTAILEQIVADPAGTDGDRWMLAKLYIQHNDWPRARTLLRRLATAENPQPQFVATYVSELLRHGELSEAESWLPRLESLDRKGDFTPVLQAKTEVARGRAEAAVEVLDRASNKPGFERSPGRLGEILAQLAADASDQSQSRVLRAAAERYYRESLSTEPQARAAALVFLASQGYVAECLAQCATWFRDTKDPAAILVALSVIRQPVATQADHARGEGLAREAIASGHESAGLQTALGSYFESVHRFDEAILAYRRAVSLDPTDAAASNNLAILLAHRGEVSEALQLIDKVIERHGPLPVFLDSRGSIRLAAGQVDLALEDFDKAIADQPSPVRLFHAALAQYRAKRVAEAQKSFRAAVERGLQPDQLHAAEKSDFVRLSKQFSS